MSQVSNTQSSDAVIPRVKICGITRCEDAVVASQSGADAIGLVFYEPSPRAVTVSQAQSICRELGPFTTVVGLFVNAESEFVTDVLRQVPLHVLQFHGDESPEYCEQFQRPWIKALRMKPGVDLQQVCEAYSSATGILVDSYTPGIPGGTGKVFDWSQLPPSLAQSLILAGGLSEENVGQAIQQLKPQAVDVSGGVESAPGQKDVQKIKGFIKAVHQAVCQ